MQKNYFLLFLLIFVPGCQKDVHVTAEDSDNNRATVTCIIPENVFNDGLTIVSMVDGHVLSTNTTSLSMLQSDKPQMVVVLDDDDNVRMLYRGIISESDDISIDARSTALAMITCNPTVSLVGDSNYFQIIGIIENLISFPDFLQQVENTMDKQGNVFDTTNLSIVQSMSKVIVELLGNTEADTSQQTMRVKSIVDHIPFVNHQPIVFELPDDSPDYGVGGNFALRNLALCPTWYGTLETEGGRLEQVIVPTRSSYTLLGSTSDLLLHESLIYGERCYLNMDYNSSNTIKLTNIHDERAEYDVGQNFAMDIMRIIPFTLSERVWGNMASTLGSMTVNAVVGARNDNRPIWEASKGIAKAIWDEGMNIISTEIARGILGEVNKEWSEKMVRVIGGKICAFHNAITGTGNIGLRIYYLLKYPNDLEFCFKHKWDEGNECDVFVQCTSENDDDYWVDLDLPSGLLWASYNVGASEPEDFGDYFAWGEVQTKNYYSWTTYRYCRDYDSTAMWGNANLTKYCNNSSYGYNGFRDNLVVLLPEDDIATILIGNGARIPTKEEWEELFQNTTSYWTSINGVQGRRFGRNGKSIFLPAAGGYWENQFCPTDSYGTSLSGSYWTSSLCLGSPDCAWCADFVNNQVTVAVYNRANGIPVRAVK